MCQLNNISIELGSKKLKTNSPTKVVKLNGDADIKTGENVFWKVWSVAKAFELTESVEAGRQLSLFFSVQKTSRRSRRLVPCDVNNTEEPVETEIQSMPSRRRLFCRHNIAAEHRQRALSFC